MADQPEDERASMEHDEASAGDEAELCSGGDEEEEEADEEGEEEEDEEIETTNHEAILGSTSNTEININSFDELRLESKVVDEVQECWRVFINSAASKEAAGDALYGAFFEASPAIQHLFTSPRAIAAMKLMAGLHSFAMGLSDPAELKAKVENLAFGHLAIEVTVPRVVLFRDALLDLFTVELGSRLTSSAAAGWGALLNYVGGAIIYIKVFYAARISLLGESWAIANKDEGGGTSMRMDKIDDTAEKAKQSKQTERHEDDPSERKQGALMQNVPTTFKEMFQFNAAVMGFGSSVWMNEVLACFENVVLNVANPTRLSEECDFIVCRIAKVATGKVNLQEFKSGMLASLRSLLPKDWTTQHEVAWSWLWDLVERQVIQNLGNPAKWERAYAKFLGDIDEAMGFQLRRDIYLKFFALAPAGQDFFKQSNTYLHLVSTKVLNMVIDIYRDPVKMVDDISAVGLRHVGYGIPTEFVPPFASSTVEVIGGLTNDQTCIDGFAWSIGLIAKSVVRTITEGSTIVMKAINVNTKKAMNRAFSAAPRGQRSKWLLLIQVGSQNISPLAWAIESGALEAASAMLKDLLTFRADRDRYYYAADELFVRHPTIVAMILSDAPSLLPELLDGLIWRSRLTLNGTRRVNYYVKHLLIDPEGKFAKTLEWVIRAKDPKIVCHPTLVWLSDDVWSRVACRSFIIRKSWFVFVLVVFIVTQSVLAKEEKEEEAMRVAITALRAFIYIFSLGGLLVTCAKQCITAYRDSDTFKVFWGLLTVPTYLKNWPDVANLLLLAMLIAMLATEPILYCLPDDGGVRFTDTCAASQSVLTLNSEFAMFALFLYCALLVDLAVFNNRVSAYVLVVARMLSEVGLFLFALCGMLLTFSSGLGCMEQPVKEFQGIHTGSLALWELFIGILDDKAYKDMREEPLVLIGAFSFMIATSVFLLNLLIAQLTCAYGTIYADMVGYARIKRIRTIVESMPQVSERRWQNFVQALGFESKIEFNKGDVGLNNGVATTEPASAHPTTEDIIKRFGGSTSPNIQWPEEDGAGGDENDKFDRLELIIKRAMERITKGDTSARRGGGGTSNSLGNSGTGGGSEDLAVEEEEDEEAAAAEQE